MHVLIAVKSPAKSKSRLSSLLSAGQRVRLSKFMLEDMLECLNSVKELDSINIVSCDSSIELIAKTYRANFIRTQQDKGYSEDALYGIEQLRLDNNQPVVIIPADIPHLIPEDVRTLVRKHVTGLSLCPASADSGTNAFAFNFPLTIPLLFGIDSLSRYRNLASERNIPVQVAELDGFARDIDRPADLFWLKDRANGGRTWAYLQDMQLTGKVRR